MLLLSQRRRASEQSAHPTWYHHIRQPGYHSAKRKGGAICLALLLILGLLATLPGLALAAITITEYPIPTAISQPAFITSGPDGNLWFTEFISNKIGKITTAGVITEYPIPTAASSAPFDITSGPDGNLWFTENGGSKIGKVVPSRPPGVSVAFGAASIPVGSTTSLTFTITNPNAATALTGLSFSSTLPANVVVATPNGLANSCGGTLAATASSTSLSLSAGTLAVGASCTVKVDVLASSVGSASVNVSGAGVITSTETGPGVASNTAALTITTLGTPVVPLPPAPKPVANPADIVAQLRVKPDRFASTDPANLISYSLSIKNIGPGKANTLSLRFPIDPNLAVGYATDFSDSLIWVSAIVTDVSQPYIQINLPSLDTNATPLTLTLVFRDQRPMPRQEPASSVVIKCCSMMRVAVASSKVAMRCA